MHNLVRPSVYAVDEHDLDLTTIRHLASRIIVDITLLESFDYLSHIDTNVCVVIRIIGLLGQLLTYVTIQHTKECGLCMVPLFNQTPISKYLRTVTKKMCVTRRLD